MLKTKFSSQFKKDYKRCIKRGLDISKLNSVLLMLVSSEELPESMRDHELVGNYARHRECHLSPDWLLIYKINHDLLVLAAVRTGSHSDLLGK